MVSAEVGFGEGVGEDGDDAAGAVKYLGDVDDEVRLVRFQPGGSSYLGRAEVELTTVADGCLDFVELGRLAVVEEKVMPEPVVGCAPARLCIHKPDFRESSGSTPICS